MSEKVFSAGDEIDSYCTTCKAVVAHRVFALVDGKVDKVICNTCKKKHKYRPNPPKSRTKSTKSKAQKSTTTKKKTTRTRRSKDPAVIWEESLSGKDLSRSKPYVTSDEFRQDDIIDHKKFGPGLIVQIMAEGKMEVIFKEGTKLMVYGRA